MVCLGKDGLQKLPFQKILGNSEESLYLKDLLQESRMGKAWDYIWKVGSALPVFCIEFLQIISSSYVQEQLQTAVNVHILPRKNKILTLKVHPKL